MKRPRRRLLPLLLLLATSCASTEDAKELQAPLPPALEPSLPWTTAFLQPAVLVAERISIEGPPGLIAHFAAQVDEEFHVREEELTELGYRQSFRVRKDGPLVEIRGYLDRLQLVALDAMVVLERPGEVELVVEATGDVFYALEEGQHSERVPAKRLVGRRPGPR